MQVNAALCLVIKPFIILLSLDVLRKFPLKLSKYSVVNLQLTHRWKRNAQFEVSIDSNLI